MEQTLSKRMTFSAGHSFWNPQWDDAKNKAVFGADANPNGYGHNYAVEITVAGTVDPDTGMIINFYTLNPVLDEVITQPLDQKHLNKEVPYFKETVPTLENITVYIWTHLEPEISALGLKLTHIKVLGDDRHFVECDGISQTQRKTA